MSNKGKLKILVAVFFFFILILVGMLVYVMNLKSDIELAEPTASVSTSAVAETTAMSSDSVALSTASPSTSAEAKETIDLKLYIYDADDYDNAKEVKTVKVDKKLYNDDITAAINKLLASTPLQIQKATVNGSSIVVDLPDEVAQKFNQGSTMGIIDTNILVMTMLNLPGIEQLQVTVEGKAGVEEDHFSFDGTFKKSDTARKYSLTK